MSPTANILSYDDAVDTDGVSIREDPDFLRIILPPIGRNRYPSVWYWVGLAWCLLEMLGIAAVARNASELIWTIAAFSAGLSVIAFFTVAHWRSHHTFEVSRDAFTIRKFFGRRQTNVITYRRDRVHNIHRAAGQTKLMMSISGRDFLELNISSDKAVVDRVAAKLQEVATRDQAAVDPNAPYEITREDIARAEQGKKIPLIVLLATLSAILLVVTILSFGVGIFLFVLIAPLAGLLLGTQKKDFWL